MPSKDSIGIDGAEEYPDDERSGPDQGAPEDDSILDEETSRRGTGTDEGSSADEGGGGAGRQEDEAAGTEEVHEVVAQPPPRRKGNKPRSSGKVPGKVPGKGTGSRTGKASGKVPGKGPVQAKKPGSRTRLYAVVLLIIILVPVIGAAYFYLGPAGSIKKIDLIATPYTNDVTGVSGLALAAFVDTGKPSELSGSADLQISYNGSTVYTGSVPVADSKVDYKLPLNDFAVGNGNYGIRFTFQGFTQTANFPVTDLIQALNITATVITAQTNATLVQQGSAMIGVYMVFLNSNDPIKAVSEVTTGDDHLTIEITRAGVTEKYPESLSASGMFSKFDPAPGNGNCTVTATFQNSKVNPTTSPYYSIVGTAVNSTGGQLFLVQIPPYAVVDGGNKTLPWKIGGVDVTFSATGSKAYEGATIVSYWWDYNDAAGTGEEGVTVTYHYSAMQPAGSDSYLVTLSVTDSNDMTDFVDVSVTFV